MPDEEWSQDIVAEYKLHEKDLKKLLKDCSELRIQELKTEVNQLKHESLATYVLKFPVVHTCMLLGAISSDWNDGILHRICHQPWNSAPN